MTESLTVLWWFWLLIEDVLRWTTTGAASLKLKDLKDWTAWICKSMKYHREMKDMTETGLQVCTGQTYSINNNLSLSEMEMDTEVTTGGHNKCASWKSSDLRLCTGLGQNSSPSDLHFILLFHYSYTVIVLSVRDSWNSLPPEVVDIPSSL